MDQPRYLTGQFLLATPGMADPRFSKSLIAICAHDENGVLGINLGDTSDSISFHGVLRQFDIPTDNITDRIVYLGGPVEPHRGFIIHSLDMNLSGTLQVSNRWGLSSSVDMLNNIAKNNGPEKWLIAMGYSGWGEGQLESELTQNGWAVAQGQTDWLYNDPSEDKWRTAWESQGIDPAHLSGGFGSA